MWFDARKALADLVGGDMPPSTHAPATIATLATTSDLPPQRVAAVAGVAAPRTQTPNSDRVTDAALLADLLSQSGPRTYGAAASALGWGATRAWQAEAFLRAAGRVRFDAFGRATLKGPGHERPQSPMPYISDT